MLEIKRPVSATLSPKQVTAIQETCRQFRATKGGLLPALHAVQGLCGNWLPLEALKLVSQGMDVPYPYLYGVLSFYTMYSTQPRGKYVIRVCARIGADKWVLPYMKIVTCMRLGITPPAP